MNVEDESLTTSYHTPCRLLQLLSIQWGTKRWNIWVSEGGAAAVDWLVRWALDDNQDVVFVWQETQHHTLVKKKIISYQIQNTQWALLNNKF